MISLVNIALVLLSVAVLALGLVVLALMRQIGVLAERIAPAGALMINQSLKVGDKAPEFALPSVNGGQQISIGKPSNLGKSTLLFFAGPDCPVCKSLMHMLKSAGQAESHWLKTVIATDAPLSAVTDYVDKHDLQNLEVVNSEALGRGYAVSKLPYAVLISDGGFIESLGIVNSREHLESMFNAKEKRVASIQEYMRRKSLA